MLRVLWCFYRYRETNDDVDITDQETKHLEKLKQIIEERKKVVKKTTPDVITLKAKKNTKEEKQIENNDANDELESEVNLSVEVEEPPAKKPAKEKAEKPTHEFKVLGINEFEKKTKVRNKE